MSGRCEVHRRPAWRPDIPRIEGRRLQHLRQQLFAREPFCRLCKAQGRKVLAVIRDHVIPLAEGGTESAANTQPLCRACSDAKSQREAARGRARGK
jgi:5-methylcytosine-specific restriction protein A